MQTLYFVLLVSLVSTSAVTNQSPPSDDSKTNDNQMRDQLRTNSNVNQIYMDTSPADTELYLSQIRQLTLETYKLSYERNSERVCVGAIGPSVPLVIPEAVEIVPKRTLPPAKKGEKPIVIENVPVVHEQTLFMYGVGATQVRASVCVKEKAKSQPTPLRLLF